MLKIKLTNAYFYGYYAYEDYGLLALMKTVLDAPLKIKSGKTMVYEDKFSGAEMKVTSKGAKVDKIKIATPLPEGFGEVDGKPETVMEISFGSKAPSMKKLKKGFKKLHEDGDEGVFDLFRMKMTVDDFEKKKSGFFGSWSTGSAGDDVFRLRDGDDYVAATTGNDKIDGGTGFDYVDYGSFDFFGMTDMKITTSKGALKVAKGGGYGVDTLKGVEALNLGSGDDKVNSKLKSDMRISANGGDDQVRTGGGDDLLIGGPGSDVLRGGKGDDVLVGGTGYGSFGLASEDRLYGQGGSDMFVLDTNPGWGGSSLTIVKDFRNGTDFLALVGIDYADVDMSKNGKHVDLEYNGQVFARIEKTKMRDLDREDFHSDYEPGLIYDFF